jgi:thiamine biosynthesis lipoprotein
VGAQVVAFAAGSVYIGASDTALEELRLAGRTQGTTYHVRAFRDPRAEPTAAEVEGLITAELDRVDRLLSNWRDDSEVERFNAAPAAVAFPLSPETATLLERSREIWSLTDGAFDPAIGATIRLWGFGGAPHRTSLPTLGEIQAALLDAGMRHLSLEKGTLSKDRPGVRVDLNGIAQGYTVDRVFALLQSARYTRALVEIGGEVRVGEPPPAETAWRVGIDSPEASGVNPILSTLVLVDAAVSTSGTYNSAFKVDGVEYSHILDPRDGRPIRNGMVMATVVAPDATTTDGLDTALMVLGPEKSLALVARLPGVECFLLARRNGALVEFRSPGWGLPGSR